MRCLTSRGFSKIRLLFKALGEVVLILLCNNSRVGDVYWFLLASRDKLSLFFPLCLFQKMALYFT